jgi:enamine deaminase RidA (YjgF/YER057c/UK114 family)
MTAVHTAHVAEPPRPAMFSNARVVNGHFYSSGMHAGDGAGGILGDGSTYDQARQTFLKIQHLLTAAGGRMDDIVTLRVYVTDIDEKAAVGRARAEFFTGDFPCSTLVEVSRLVEPGLTVEIEAEAIIGNSAR